MVEYLAGHRVYQHRGSREHTFPVYQVCPQEEKVLKGWDANQATGC